MPGHVLLGLQLAACLLLGWLAAATAWAQAPHWKVSNAPTIELTEAERVWITANPVVRIGNPPMAPYHYVENGRHTGYQIEIMEAMLKRVGLQPSYSDISLGDLLDGMRAGTQDVILDPIYRKDREEFIAFSERGFDVTLGIFARYDRSDISNLASLQGKRIASYRGYALEAKLRKLLPDSSVIQADNVDGMLRLVASGAADFCVQELRAGEFILAKGQISNVATKGVLQVPGEAAARAHDYGVRKDLPLLKAILDKAYRALDPAEKQRIWNRWFGATPDTQATFDIVLTPEESAWLAARHTVRVRISDYAPYMFSKPVPAGMSVDYLTAVAKRLGFQVEFVPATLDWPTSMQDVMGPRQHYDLLPTMNRSPEREQKFSLSMDYLTAPLVIYTRNDGAYVGGLDALKGKTVAAEKGYVVTQRLKAEYPGIRLLEVKNSADALLAVATKRADAFIGNMANASYLIKEQRLHNLMRRRPDAFRRPIGRRWQCARTGRCWPGSSTRASPP